MPKKTPKTRSQVVAADVAALLRARNPLLWIITREEARVERHLVEAAASAGYEPLMWDVGQGVTAIDGSQKQFGAEDPGETLDAIRDSVNENKRTVWIMRDLPVWITGPVGATPLRKLRNLARLLPGKPRDEAQAIIVLTPSAEIPPELAGHATVIEWPLPDRAEIAAILDAAIDALPDEIKENAAPDGTRDAAIDAAVGLSGEEAAACYARSLVQTRKIDPVLVGQEKKRIIARERVLEWHDPLPDGLTAVGGLDNLKAWLMSRKSAYTAKARAYGLPAPKGALFVGVSGCGKSLLAKATATAWGGLPLLRLDLGALQSKFVGESQSNLRKALSVIEAIGRCVVWLDEIEKALAGATQGAADGGVSADALGAILNWMQERQGEAFVIATANDITSLPPELLRKGRFDEIWWVDLPNTTERAAVLSAALRQYGRGELGDTEIPEEVAKVTDGFTGAEIAAIVPDALFAAFADDGREIELRDLVAAAKSVVPLTRTAGDKILKMREWAKGRARFASTPEAIKTQKKTRELDI